MPAAAVERVTLPDEVLTAAAVAARVIVLDAVLLAAERLVLLGTVLAAAAERDDVVEVVLATSGQ